MKGQTLMLTSNLTAVPAIRRQNPAFGEVVIKYESFNDSKKPVLERYDCETVDELKLKFQIAEAENVDELSRLKGNATKTVISDDHNALGTLSIRTYITDILGQTIFLEKRALNTDPAEKAIQQAIDMDKRYSEPIEEDDNDYQPW